MNDPNGLIFHDGVYHLFFQHNPEAHHWDNMSWGHATSPDLVHWTEHPLAIPHGPDEHIFSGSVVADTDDTAGFAAGGRPALVAIYTSAYHDGRQAQSLAYSTDAGMTWVKYAGNPVLDRDSRDFRDPRVFRYHPASGPSYWVMVAAMAVEHRVVLYRSDDLRDWTYLSTFGPANSIGGLWECPDLFPLAVGGDGRTEWVLIVSVNPGGVAGGSATQYFLGEFDGVTFTCSTEKPSDGKPDTFDWLDWGRDFYAAVTFDGVPDGRRILLGWMNNWDYARHVPTSPWRGSMSLARELSLNETEGRLRLVQAPVPELAVLERTGEQITAEPFTLTDRRLYSGGPHYRIVVEFEPLEAEAFGLEFLIGDGHSTHLTYSMSTGRLSLDRTRSGNTDFDASFPSLDAAPVDLVDGALKLDVFVDRTSVEVFAQDGSVCMTQQVFAPAGSTSFALASAAGGTRVRAFAWTPLNG
jgi:sucrose-6-phosphate hydrolase SacC (GH32 family)